MLRCTAGRHSSRTVLRQFIFNHGPCTPPVPMGAMRDWLVRIPKDETIHSMDACTVVLPRPGDGWYAPPPSGDSMGFPWGELTEDGAVAMRARGGKLSQDVENIHWADPEVMVRCVNTPACITSAQAMILGASEAGASKGCAVEVLLQQGEELLPVIKPGMPGFPSVTDIPQREQLATVEVELRQVLEKLLKEQKASVVGARRILETVGDDDEVYGPDWESALRCLEAVGTTQGSGVAEQIAKIQSFNFLRWVAPLQAGGIDAATAVMGPLLRDIFVSCDSALESTGGDTPPCLRLYFSQAETLAALLGVLSLASSSSKDFQSDPRFSKLTWPGFGSSLEFRLVLVAGEPFISFVHDGTTISWLGQESFPYSQVRARFAALCDAAGSE